MAKTVNSKVHGLVAVRVSRTRSILGDKLMPTDLVLASTEVKADDALAAMARKLSKRLQWIVELVVSTVTVATRGELEGGQKSGGEVARKRRGTGSRRREKRDGRRASARGELVIIPLPPATLDRRVAYPNWVDKVGEGR